MSDNGLWCEVCAQALPYLDARHCPVCALPNPTGEICGRCLSHPTAFSHTLAVFSYDFPLDKLILAMKFGENLALANVFAEKLALLITTEKQPDFLIPMPLHPARLRERGYNQSLLIAQKLSRLSNIPLLTTACQRTRHTATQSSLPWKERSKNVRDAFSCERDLSGKHIALIDDVMTTGASLDALAKVVLKSGAREVSAWVVARTLPHKN